MEKNIPENESKENSAFNDGLQKALFYELYSDLPRLGVGSIFSTRKAYEAIAGLPEKPEILDIGCGYGMQSLELARLSEGKVVALDNYQPFLDRLNAEAMVTELDELLSTRNASMFELPFDDNSFDLIWSEGAIFIMGFEAGLKAWSKLLKQDGYIAVSEATWTTDQHPEEIQQYWDAHYPAITTIAENIKTMTSCGFQVEHHFTLPSEDWWTHYYTFLENKIPAYLEKHGGNKVAVAIAGMALEEMDMHDKYSDFYSYEFFVGKKL